MNTSMPFFGEICAVTAAIIFAWTSILFTTAGQRLGNRLVNLLRLPFGGLCLALLHLAIFGRIWPSELDGMDHFWIAMSGVVGLAAGDSALFSAFVRIGPRRSLMVMATAPIFTVILAWFILDEQLDLQALAGIAVIIGGVMLAASGREDAGEKFSVGFRGRARLGWLLALGGAAGQGIGSVFAKMGMDEQPALSATLVRVVWAAVAAAIFILPRLNLRESLARLRDVKGITALGGAILAGPFISVWISLVAIKHADAGIAQVLLSMVPIFVIAPAWIAYGDRPSWRSLMGVTLAVGGGALLFLR